MINDDAIRRAYEVDSMYEVKAYSTKGGMGDAMSEWIKNK